MFDAAGKAGWVLFFDEADALFGKRTEVKATNIKTSVDNAFTRRIRYIVRVHDA